MEQASQDFPSFEEEKKYKNTEADEKEFYAKLEESDPLIDYFCIVSLGEKEIASILKEKV